MMKLRNVNPSLSIAWIFTIIGLLICIPGACVLISGAVKAAAAEEVTAVVTSVGGYVERNGNSSNQILVEYIYDGEVYSNVPLGYYSSALSEGDRVDVRIDEANPGDPIDTMFSLMFGGIFGGVGFVFALIGIIMLCVSNRKKQLSRRLIEEGYYIEAQYEGVEWGNIRVNGRPTSVIRCAYHNPNDGKFYIFRSEQLLFNPELLIGDSSIRVYVDRNNFKNYYVDVSEFKEKYIEC